MKKLLLISILFSTVTFADFHSAIDSYERGEYATAYDEFLSMAQTGEKQSQFNLGVMFYQGQHVEKNLNKAYAWLKLATEGDTVGEQENKIFKIVTSEITALERAEQEYKRISDKYSTQSLLDTLYPEFISPENGGAFDAKPIKIVQPKYPRKAALKGVQGWSRFSFDLDKHGVPRNIQLLESFPGDVFTLTSLRAIKKWRFNTIANKNGKIIPRQNLLYTLQFRLSNADPIHLKKGVYEKTMARAKKGDFNAQFEIGYWEMKLQVSEGKINPNEWFLKAAIQGHPNAQYELGKSLVYGNGCRQDKAKGLEWLTRSAHNGLGSARQLLASVASKQNTLESQKEAIAYLDGLEKLSAKTQLNLAWMLATSPFAKIADPKKSLEIVDNMSWKNFSDDITLYEIRAAANAALGRFDKAVDLQEDALDEAEDLDADLTLIKEHLARYQKREKWF